MSLWDSLDDLGSTVTNVAGQVLNSAGSLVTAEVNNRAALATDPSYVGPYTAAPTADPNAWQKYLLMGLAAAAVVAVIVFATRK